MRIVIVTHLMSPYQVELFNIVSALNKVDLQVIYLHRTSSDRLWTEAKIHHQAICLEDEPGQFEAARANVLDADLAIFNYYAERYARELLNSRARTGRAWCFWGERPGFRKPEWVGRFLRRLILTEFHNSRVPIWGIGQFAVEGYQKEFGSGRTYNNLPYFSDLTRFQCTTRNGNGKSEERVFLFSGSLIRRKGVDLLGRAFLRLAREMPAVRLKLMGSGELQNKLIQMLEPVQTQVEFLGFKDWSELPDYYAQSHVLCVPSRYDGWGLVVPEGLASGLPVIGTTQMGAALELIKTGRNGWLIPAGDEAAIYTAMRNAAMLSPTELSQLSCNARESVIEHSLEQGAERFIHAARDAYSQW